MFAGLQTRRTLYKVVFLLFVSIFIPCFSSTRDLRSLHLDGQIDFFYFDPRPVKIRHIIRETAALGEFDYRCFFYEALFKRYRQQALVWIKDAQVRLEDHDSLIFALWKSGLKSEAIDRAQKAGWSIKDQTRLLADPKSVLDFPLEKEGYLSCMCCYFFTTGDTTYMALLHKSA
jgi:hypothetical protein